MLKKYIVKVSMDWLRLLSLNRFIFQQLLMKTSHLCIFWKNRSMGRGSGGKKFIEPNVYLSFCTLSSSACLSSVWSVTCEYLWWHWQSVQIEILEMCRYIGFMYTGKKTVNYILHWTYMLYLIWTLYQIMTSIFNEKKYGFFYLNPCSLSSLGNLLLEVCYEIHFYCGELEPWIPPLFPTLPHTHTPTLPTTSVPWNTSNTPHECPHSHRYSKVHKLPTKNKCMWSGQMPRWGQRV